jgi:hypothetical protein
MNLPETLRKPALFATICFCNVIAAFGATSGDDFNDNSKDPTKWGTDTKLGHGVLTERLTHLEYTVSSPTTEDDAWRPWILHRFPFNADWELQFDVANTTTPNLNFQVNSMGVLIQPVKYSTNDIFVELYSSSLGGPPARTGFLAELDTGDQTLGSVDKEGAAGVTNGAFRIIFYATNKVFEVYYDVDVSDGYQWVGHASFGVAGTGGVDGDTDWGLGDDDQFAVSIYGYSSGMIITSSQMVVDNFSETGGVVSAGGPTPDPIGNFHFRFPTNNPLVTKIVSIIGNYQGVSQTSSQRSYNIDVAQDESGKITAMGTMDGITDANTNSQLSASVGSVKTVAGEPTAQLNGGFKGTRDGVKMSFNGKATIPLEVVDVGGGTNGVTGTGSYSSKIGNLPFSGRNLPVNVAAPPGSEENLKKDWSLELDISRKLIGTKERTIASARLELPNGDVINYPERVAKYSATKGYTLSFTRGTNVTVNPPKIVSKSRVSIKGLTLTRQGDTYEPTGGVIMYQFLGQKGTANLMEFVEP